MRDLENVNTDSAARQSTICQSSIKFGQFLEKLLRSASASNASETRT